MFKTLFLFKSLPALKKKLKTPPLYYKYNYKKNIELFPSKCVITIEITFTYTCTFIIVIESMVTYQYIMEKLLLKKT